jgi:hypothetical protein
MNPDDTTVGTIVLNNGTLGMVSGNSGGITTIANTITVSVDSAEEIMERWIFNRVTVDHKVQEQELMKLKEVAPDYANEIKENLSKNASRDIIKKMRFTKKHDKDADVHHFIGRVWAFTEEELREFIKEIKGV